MSPILAEAMAKPKNHHMTFKQMKAAMAAAFGEQVVQVRGGACLEPWSAVYVVYQERYRHWLAWDGTHFFDPLSTAKGPSRTIRRKITRVVTSGGLGRINARAISELVGLLGGVELSGLCGAIPV